MANIKVSVINACTVLTDGAISAMVANLQTQVHRDFAPLWGIDADLTFVPKAGAGRADPNTWWLVIMDNSDVQGALGYHDVTPRGLPIGKVFAATDIRYGYSWSVTASHELLEMLADPDVNLTVFDQSSNSGGRLWAYEVCDPVESDSLGYMIGNTRVSDFVTPQYFQRFLPAGTRYDFRNQVHAPFQILSGGFMSVFDIRSGTGWKMVTAENVPTFASRANLGSRRERRFTPRDHWITSEVR